MNNFLVRQLKPRFVFVAAALLAGAGCGGADVKKTSMRIDPVSSQAANAAAIAAGVSNPASAHTSSSSPQTPQPLPSVSAACTVATGTAPLQRMSSTQYSNTVTTLLGLSSGTMPSLQFDVDEMGAGPFAAIISQTVGSNEAYQYMVNAEALAQVAASQNFAGILPCTYSALNASCVSQFLTQFGAAAFRRPLTATEVTTFTNLASAQVSANNFSGAVQLLIQGFLESPDFLYRPLVGTAPGSGTLTPYEVASRLSYSLWNAPPDQALLAAAAASQLNAAGIKAQAARMITDARFGQSAGYFVQQLLALQGVATATKDPSVFPNYTPALGQAIAQETFDFSSHVFLQDDARLNTLLTAPYSVLSPPLFAFYGISEPTNWTPGMTVQLNSSGSGARLGILTQAAYTSAQAHSNATNVVARGKVIRENLLCQILPAPPDNVPPLPPRVPGAQTARQTFAVHETNPACAACHTLMDPMGLSFEHFDATGAWRATDSGLTIDASGSYSSPHQTATTFNDALQLATELAANPDVQNCVVLQVYRFINQRLETPADACELAQLQTQFSASNHDLRALMASIVTNSVFATFPGQ